MSDARPPTQPWCRGLLIDGPDKGMEVYAVRRIGSTVTTQNGTYQVVDDQPEVVLLSMLLRE